jgi:hypothetical protein
MVASALLLGLVGACATSTGDDSLLDYDAGGHDAGFKYDANIGHDSGATACAAMCTQNSDCQSGCATGDLCSSGQCQSASTGVSCCDMQSGVCYIETQQCPAPSNDGGLE